MSIRKEFRLNDFEVEYLYQYASAHNCTVTTALKQIIKEHSDSKNNPATSFIAKEIADNVAELLYKPMTRIRLGVNNADKNSQILIELINSIFASNPDYFFVERKQSATEKADMLVKKRIEEYRIKKLDRETGSVSDG